MRIIRYTLLADGSSDSALLPIINWTIERNYPEISFEPQFAKSLGDIGHDLSKKIERALTQFPCDILFLHRDAERQDHAERVQEIIAAAKNTDVNYIPIVPIRMTEAWLLSDETAIRAASGNKNGKNEFALPAKKQWETTVDPKAVLFEALKCASGKKGRALEKFYPSKQRARVAELTEDFSVLRGLKSFDAFEKELIAQFGKF